MNTENTDKVNRVFKIKLPMRVKTSNKKKQALNLNVYRNLHHRSLHAQKTKFEELAKKLLRKIPPLGIITLHYDVCPQSKRRLDIMNVGSIVDKYFSDCLTSHGIIEDDDFKHIPLVSFAFGGLVKCEHVLVTITEIKLRKGTPPMRVLLDQTDIQKALTTYVDGLNIPDASGVQLDYNNGVITAEVLFGSNDDLPTTDPADPPEPKKRGRGGRPRGSKNRPKEGVADVDETLSASADGSGEGADTTPAVETPDGDETETTEDTARKNLFGDEENPSSEDDGEKAEATSDDPPKSSVKKGSIFDS